MLTTKKSRVAYIVVCWNNRTIIDECLQAIQKQTVAYKSIYLIDNASSDGSATYVADNYPDIHLVASGRNNGFARGNNIMLRECLKDKSVTHIALINSDAMLDAHWTEEILAGIEGKRKVGCVQGATLDYYDHSTVDSLHIYVRDDFQSVQFAYGERFRPEYSYPRRVFGVNAAAAMYTREFIESQPRKFFDERFYMYLEDVDVAFRSVIEGWHNYYIPTAMAYHMGSVSSKKRASGYNYYMTYRNQSALLIKNVPLSTYFRLLPKLIRNDVRFYRHYKLHDPALLKKMINGRLVGLLRAPLYLASRWRIQRRRKIPVEQLERVIRNQGLFVG